VRQKLVAEPDAMNLTSQMAWTYGALLLGGCAHRIWNEPIGALAPGDRYEMANRLLDNSEDVFVVLAFSGGGTRAAYFGLFGDRIFDRYRRDFVTRD